MRTKTSPTPLQLPEYIRPIKLKYPARCKCGRQLRKGQPAFYDTAVSKPLCRTCVEQTTEDSLTEACSAGTSAPASGLLSLISDFHRLMSMPLPRQAEDQKCLFDAVERLRMQHADDDRARRLLIEFFEIRLPRSSRCIKLNYETNCCVCAAKLTADTAAIWDAAARRTWCFYCAALTPQFRAEDGSANSN